MVHFYLTLTHLDILQVLIYYVSKTETTETYDESPPSPTKKQVKLQWTPNI